MVKQKWSFVLAISTLCFSAWAQADSLSEQRTRYQEIKAAWDAKDTAQVENYYRHYKIILFTPILNIAKLPTILMWSLRLW